MKRACILLLVFLMAAVALIAGDGQSQRKGATLVSLYSGFPADTGTDNPFDAWPPLGLSVEHVFPEGLAVGVSLRYSRWKDYMGMFYNTMGTFCGAWTFNALSPSMNLSYHPLIARRGVLSPFFGMGVGLYLTRDSNALTLYSPPELADLKSQAFVQAFAGIRLFPFRRAAGWLRDFGFLAQANVYEGGGFRPFMVFLGITQRL